MTTPLHTIPADSTLGELLLAMVDQGIHHLPLTRQGRLVGIVTDTDLLRRESPARPPPTRPGGQPRAAGRLRP
jgi:CBS domain-containing protein